MWVKIATMQDVEIKTAADLKKTLKNVDDDAIVNNNISYGGGGVEFSIIKKIPDKPA
jgi:hypothetical protein